MRQGPELGLSIVGREIYEGLRDDIVFGRLHPRERLVEVDLVVRFATHRAAVREALAALEQAGLVERTRNKGASVRDLSPAQVEQIYTVRLLLEAAALRSLPLPLGPAALEALVAIQEAHESAVERVDLRRIFEHNNRFHQAMYAQAGNPYLAELIEQCATRALTVRFHPYTDQNFLRQVCDDHWAMLDAIRHCDRERLLVLLHHHLPLAKERYLMTYHNHLEHGFVFEKRA